MSDEAIEIDNEKVHKIAAEVMDFLTKGEHDLYHVAAAFQVLINELQEQGIEIEILDFESSGSYH